jgi:diacylglycerol kinase family enzyme
MSFSPFRSINWSRPAAVVALLVALIVAGAMLDTVVHSFDDLIAVLISLFIVAFCAWFALTRSGLMRLLVVPPGLLGLVLLVGTLGDHLRLMVVLVVLLTLFGITGRYAVRQKAPTRTVTRHPRPANPALGGVLIINPKAGGGKAERFDLATEARKRGIEPVLLERGRDLGELAERACARGADVIGMAGGDGSQALLASVLMQHDVAHVCVPAGTRNHFALDLGLDRNDVVGALEAFTDSVEHRIDLASVNEHVFVNNASVGLYAEVVQSDTYRDAKLRTWHSMLPDMVRPGGGSIIDLRFDDPNARAWSDATLVVVSNNPYFVKRLRGVGTRPRLDTGGLGILAARTRDARTVASLVTLGAIGQALRSRGLEQWSSGEFEIRSDRPIPIGLDGEAFVLTPPLHFVSLPGVLRVRVPRTAKGLSPAGAAVTLSWRNLATLARIAAGKQIEQPAA